MTAIAYHNGLLIGDNQHLSLSSPVQKIYADKIFRSECNGFAFGFSNTTINESLKPVVEEFVQKCVHEMVIRKHDCVDTAIIDKEFKINVENGFAITREEAFFFKLDVGQGLVRRTTGITQGCGSGGAILTAMLLTGLSPREAMKKVNFLDPMSGDKAFIIKASSLKPFIIRS